jgi:hypothetical protein
MQKDVAYYKGKWYHGEDGRKEAEAEAKADVYSGTRRSAVMPTYVIHAHQILANVLVKHDEITLAFFVELARDIWRAIPETAICVTNHSINCALKDYSAMFERRGDSALGRAPNFAERFTQAEVDFWFNDEMPDSIRTKFKQYFERLTP